jgi:hypothetical protein
MNYREIAGFGEGYEAISANVIWEWGDALTNKL